MDCEDPTTPLLGVPRESRLRRAAIKLCGLESWRKRLPVTIWLPNYSVDTLFRDIVAGITVGLTSIPQGIAYAMVAGLPPQVGLYASIFPGFVYMLFGSCKDVTVGPTAILAALLAKYVARSQDFAYLATFLSGCVIMLLGVLQLGFLLDFISKPVISGFTTAAALQISASQLKSLFRIAGSSGHTFIQAVVNYFTNVKTIQLWDSALGVSSIIFLVLLKRLKIGGNLEKVCQCVLRARNALLVLMTSILAFVLHEPGYSPFALTGKIQGGLPNFGLPPFSTVVGNQTLAFTEMLEVFGPEGFVMPLVAILESIAIAKAFAGSKTVDGTQEMIAVGACNVLASFAQSMPATGSFTRTALNHASGVVTPAGSFFKASLVLLAVTLLADAFYFIPRASLAAIIMVAMMSIIDFTIVKVLWITSKTELAVWTITLIVGACVGLEYGIAAGAVADVMRVMAHAARPDVGVQPFKAGNGDCMLLRLPSRLHYMSGARIGKRFRALKGNTVPLVIDASLLRHIDVGVGETLATVILELENEGHRIVLWNFDEKHRQLIERLQPLLKSRFVNETSIDRHLIDNGAQSAQVTY